MKNVILILKRDLLRLIKAPAALIVVLALIALPSLYTWVNVYGFWNPYNNTENMRICFVTEDEGGTNELTGELNLGDMIDETLRDNHQLGWAFMSRDEAMEEVRSGKAYAAFIVPQNFTENLLTLFSSDFTQPNIEYYVNEKLGPVSPKVSDAGSTTLDETINSTFVETVGETVVDKLNEAVINANSTLSEKDAKVVQKIKDARNALSNANNSLTELNDAIDNSQSKVDGAKTKLANVNDGIDQVESGLANVHDSTRRANEALNEYTQKVFPALSSGITKLSDVSYKSTQAINNLSADVQSAQVSVKTALEQQKTQLTQAKLLLEQLKTSANKLPDGAAKDSVNKSIESLELQIQNAQQRVNDLETISEDISSNATSISAASSQINLTTQNTANAMLSFNTTLFQTTLPALTKSMSEISDTSSKLQVAVNNQHALVTQIAAVLDQVQNSFDAAKKSVNATKSSIDVFDSQLSTLQTDVSAFSLSKMLQKIAGDGGLDSAAIGEFISSPTIIEQKSIYELNAYGSAMAPLFMNLTFWIGAFMLLVILRQEVDDEGVKNLTISQRYVSRWLLLVVFAVCQALLCDAGVVVLGVQTVNLPMFVLISCLASVAYLSIMFMLSTTLQHIGKGLCVLLAFLQIPGATGLYPIEMTTPFFQDVYPFFPFTYGINGLRETICGFYGGTFALCCVVLIMLTVVSMLIGIFVRPFLTNFNKLFAKEIREGGLYVGEEIEIPTQRFRLSQIVGYLANREDYRAGLRRRADRFVKHYSAFKKYAIAVGVILSVVVAILFAQFPYETKPTLLTAWLEGLVVLMIIVVGVEHAYDSMERQMNLDTLSDDEIRDLFHERNKVGKTTSELFREQRAGRGHVLMDEALHNIHQKEQLVNKNVKK